MRAPIGVSLDYAPSKRVSVSTVQVHGVMTGIRYYAMAAVMVAMVFAVIILCVAEFLPHV